MPCEALLWFLSCSGVVQQSFPKVGMRPSPNLGQHVFILEPEVKTKLHSWAVSRHGKKVIFLLFPVVILSSWGSPWREQPLDLLRRDLSWPTATEPSLFPRVHALWVPTQEPKHPSCKSTPWGCTMELHAPEYWQSTEQLSCSFLALLWVHFVQGRFLTPEFWQHGWGD